MTVCEFIYVHDDVEEVSWGTVEETEIIIFLFLAI